MGHEYPTNNAVSHLVPVDPLHMSRTSVTGEEYADMSPRSIMSIALGAAKDHGTPCEPHWGAVEYGANTPPISPAYAGLCGGREGARPAVDGGADVRARRAVEHRLEGQNARPHARVRTGGGRRQRLSGRSAETRECKKKKKKKIGRRQRLGGRSALTYTCTR